MAEGPSLQGMAGGWHQLRRDELKSLSATERGHQLRRDPPTGARDPSFVALAFSIHSYWNRFPYVEMAFYISYSF